ncbi:MAG: TraR/DksA family transcriptional regulator [Candidatus Latescibacteria bacterium]|nr:TraR/DksA family transcriptional regulator [bacterium]MBD3424905.1 TraR/DksA family transcriptional regulator [Candidatus Latescibacterota bacterium]
MPSRKKYKYNKKELKKFRELILAERNRIVSELGRINNEIKNASDSGSSGSNYASHLADSGTDGMEREKLYLYASQEGDYLRALDEALERIERGIYGKCESCGELIPKKRLNVVPAARMCIVCQTNQEKNQRG